jgi:hypothetical protein
MVDSQKMVSFGTDGSTSTGLEGANNATNADAESSLPSEKTKYPQKRFYRQRAHTNPMSDHDLDYPLSPEKFVPF